MEGAVRFEKNSSYSVFICGDPTTIRIGYESTTITTRIGYETTLARSPIGLYDLKTRATPWRVFLNTSAVTPLGLNRMGWIWAPITTVIP